MKQKLSLFLIVLLLCGASMPPLLAADEPLLSSDTETSEPSSPLESISMSRGAILSKQTTPPVVTVTPSIITLTSFDEPDRIDAVAFALGTSHEELSSWFGDVVAGFTGYDAQGNSYDLNSGAWSLNTVDTGTPGVYYVSATPDLGEDYTLEEGVSLPRQLCAVSIQTPGKPDINCCVSGRGYLHFPWILSAEQQEQLDAFAVWLQKNNGEWTQLSEGFPFTSADLQLNQKIFENGSTYNLKVTYPGGQTGVLTFEYDGALSIIDYGGGDRDGGDVDGGGSGSGSQPAPTPPQTPDDSPNNDTSNNNDSPSHYDSSPAQNHSSPVSAESSTASVSTPKNSPDEQNSKPGALQTDLLPFSDKPTLTTLTTPIHSAPVYSNVSLSHESERAIAAPDTKNHGVSQPENRVKAVLNPVSKSPAAVSESYSPTQTVISGLRLRDLCADGESVVFGSGDLTVSIPSSLLLALNLSDSDTLSVRLTQPESNQIRLEAEAFGKAVTELSGTIVRLCDTSQTESTEITVLNEGGEELKDIVFDGEFLHFTADQAGTYTILKSLKEAETQKATLPLLPLTSGLLLAAGGMTLFWRKHHG